MMCRVLEVSKSGFYDRRNRPVSVSAARRLEVRSEIVRIFEGEDRDNGGRTYGYRRVHAELARLGIALDDDTVRLYMRALGLVPVQVKRRRGLTRADRAA